MQTTSKIFVSCLFCLALVLVSGCIGTPSMSTAEREKADKIIADHGKKSLAVYLMDVPSDADAEMVLKYTKYFVSKGADVKEKVRSGGINYPLLYCAVMDDNLEVAKFLVSKGVDVNEKSSGGRTILDFAVGHELCSERMKKYLESVGAK